MESSEKVASLSRLVWLPVSPSTINSLDQRKAQQASGFCAASIFHLRIQIIRDMHYNNKEAEILFLLKTPKVSAPVFQQILPMKPVL